MRVMTFNTQHCKSYLQGEIDMTLMAQAIKQCDPDIEVVAADIPEIVASDHRPHTAEILLK